MALIHCPECGNQISDKAHSCPECGFPLLEYLNNNTPDVSNIEKSIDGYHENQEEKKTDLLYEGLSDSYYDAVKAFNNANSLDDYKESLRIFSKLGEYRDAIYYVDECKKKIKSINYEIKIDFFFETLKNTKDKSEIDNLDNLLNELSLDESFEAYRERIYAGIYDYVVELANSDQETSLNQAVSILKLIKDYKDANQLADIYDKKVIEIKNQNEQNRIKEIDYKKEQTNPIKEIYANMPSSNNSKSILKVSRIIVLIVAIIFGGARAVKFINNRSARNSMEAVAEAQKQMWDTDSYTTEQELDNHYYELLTSFLDDCEKYLSALEDEIIDKYNSLGSTDISDEEMIKLLRDFFIPKSKDFYNRANAIMIKYKSNALTDIKYLTISAGKIYKEGFSTMLVGLEEEDYDLIEKAVQAIEKGTLYLAEESEKALQEYCNQYGIEYNG